MYTLTPRQDTFEIQYTRLFSFRQLFKDPGVLFAGYKIPHPLEYKIVVRVRTINTYTPQEAFNNAITDLMSETSLLEEQFKEALKEKKEAN